MRKTLAILLTVLVIPGIAEGKLKKSMKKECLVCHENWLLEAKSDSSSLLSKVSFHAADKLMCLSCHDGSLADDRETFLGLNHFSHPTDKKIPEGFKLPKGFPTRNGKLYCGTCHTPHTKSGSEKKLDYTFMREANVNSALCIKCHEENAQHGMNHPILEETENKLKVTFAKKVKSLGGKLTKNGEIQCESCHSPHRGKAEKGLIEPVDNSQLCIVCHLDNLNSEEHPNFRNHPIHKKFPKKAKLEFFRNEKVIVSSVECMTCHKVHKEENKYLLIVKEKKLCSLCHIKEAKVELTDHNIGKKSCRNCHVAHKAKGRKLWSRSIPEDAWDYAALIDAKGKNDILCLSCHYPDNSLSGKKVKTVGLLTHPTGKKVKSKVSLPLTDGSLSCTTCHDPHRDYEGKFLRKDKVKLCYLCHKEQATVKKGSHGKIDEKKWKKGDCAACHSVHNAKDGFLSRVVYGEISPMEPAVDGFCLACHDPEGMAKHKIKQSIYNEHPVGVKNPTEKLPGKRISCVTCHDPHSYKEELLRIPAKGNSPLCLTCHVDKDLKGSSHDILSNRKVKLSERERKEIFEKGACSLCHTPHNPKYKVLWSRKIGKGVTINEKMCNSCHSQGGIAEDKTIGKYTHPYGANVNSQKDIAMILNSRLPLINQMTGHPAKKDEKGLMDCATCHEPHNGADKKRLIRYTIEGNSSLCTSCHVKEAAVIGTEHDMRVVKKNFRNALGEEVLKDGVCSACHVPHRAKDSLLWAFKIESVSGNKASDYCLTCHSEKGIAKEKGIKYYFHPSKSVVVRNFDRPGRKGDWPIFKKNGEKVKFGGSIACETCHDPHIWSKWTKENPGKPVEGTITNSFLRNKTLEGSICVDCHGLDALFRYKFFHDKLVHRENTPYK